MTEDRSGLTALGARVHLFVRPEARDRFTALFRDVLDCDVVELDFGLPNPILLVAFSDGSAFSVEFTDLAPEDVTGDVVDDASALRGAWIEFRTADLAGYRRRLREAGIREFRHAGSVHVYFSAPGGQVFRLLDVSYDGP
jgi:pimeloyl-ACP methyl ester carboxylesterase